MTWMRPQDDTAFVLRTSQAGRAWAFVHRLMEIVINSQPALLKANVQVLEVFLVEWRSKATVQDLEESVKRVTMFLKFRKKKGSEDPKEKTQEELAWKTGLQLMCFLLKTEVPRSSSLRLFLCASSFHPRHLITRCPTLFPPYSSLMTFSVSTALRWTR
eukprot:913779-Rhodomonas_salina.2